jgi:hypothetical protein
MTPALSPDGLAVSSQVARSAPCAFVVWRLVGRQWCRVGVTHTRSAADALAKGSSTLIIVMPLADPRLVPSPGEEGNRP